MRRGLVGEGRVAVADLRALAGRRVQRGHYVVAGDTLWVPAEEGAEGTLSGRPQQPLGGRIRLAIGEKSKARARRQTAARKEEFSRRREREGLEADPGGYWAVAAVLEVRRPVPRRGRGLEALLRWEGHDEAGVPWADSWEPVRLDVMSADQVDAARAMERAKYGEGGTKREADDRPAEGRWAQRLRHR